MIGEIIDRTRSDIPGAISAVSRTVGLSPYVFDELLDAVDQGRRAVLALEQQTTDPRFDKLQRPVKEVGGMHRARSNPLHLLENAHAVVEGLRPGRAGTDDHVIRGGGDVGRDLGRTLLEGLLRLQEKLRKALKLFEQLPIARLLAAHVHDRKGDQE